ncbi:MAG: hypothetical protein IJL66_03185 [Lachnospiraceae bacterium]|nr:hypothetical protein [Lachnospiraceae bacterium]
MPEQLFIVILVCLGILVYTAIASRRRAEARLRSRVRESFGSRERRKYSDADLERISYEFRTYGTEGFFLDDITWNDLQMDEVFGLADRTFSGVGESALYRILRTPSMDPAEIAERNRLIRFFIENDAQREKLWLSYAHIGKPRESVFKLVDNLAELENYSVWQDLLCLAAIAASIVLAVLNPSGMAILPIFAVVGSIIVYYRRKARIEPFLACVRAAVHMVRSAQEIASSGIPELETYTGELKKNAAPLRTLPAKASLLGNDGTVAGGLDAMLMDYLRMLTHMDLIAFSSLLSQVRAHTGELRRLMEVLGYLEAMVSAASFRAGLPQTAEPDIAPEGERAFDAEGLYHPFLPEGVTNDICADRCVLITGSNASGKSTFLKATALAAILAQSIGAAPASRFRTSLWHVYSSMALRDDIAARESYFVVEIRSLRRILDAMDAGEPVLAFVDEVLRGTNTVERIAASTEILRHIAGGSGLCFAATHDVELTRLLEEQFTNVHFTEKVTEDAVIFPYKLLPGPAQSRNAIRLLSVMGYDESITRASEEAAQHFLATGRWEKEGTP